MKGTKTEKLDKISLIIFILNIVGFVALTIDFIMIGIIPAPHILSSVQSNKIVYCTGLNLTDTAVWSEVVTVNIKLV